MIINAARSTTEMLFAKGVYNKEKRFQEKATAEKDRECVEELLREGEKREADLARFFAEAEEKESERERTIDAQVRHAIEAFEKEEEERLFEEDNKKRVEEEARAKEETERRKPLATDTKNTTSAGVDEAHNTAEEAAATPEASVKETEEDRRSRIAAVLEEHVTQKRAQVRESLEASTPSPSSIPLVPVTAFEGIKGSCGGEANGLFFSSSLVRQLDEQAKKCKSSAVHSAHDAEHKNVPSMEVSTRSLLDYKIALHEQLKKLKSVRDSKK